MILTQNEFNNLRELIYKKTGIALNESKTDFISRRIKARMETIAVRNCKDYLRYLSFDSKEEELQNLILTIVNHETYFFREYPQLEFFVEKIIPIIEKEKNEIKTLNVLSAGCSTGDEPYTLGIILREMLDNFDLWQVRIDGLDISPQALKKAQKGVYFARSLRDTPYVYRDRYFDKKEDTYTVKPIIQHMVNFIHANLYNHKDVQKLSKYDLVFMRNVLIYFDYASGRNVLEKLYERMNKGAFLFLGHAESVARFTNCFRMERLGNMFVYRK
jgi:chemotaxis protein methyltransferase CheR